MDEIFGLACLVGVAGDPLNEHRPVPESAIGDDAVGLVVFFAESIGKIDYGRRCEGTRTINSKFEIPRRCRNYVLRRSSSRRRAASSKRSSAMACWRSA